MKHLGQLISLIIILIPMNIKAYSCDYDISTNLKQLATNIDYTYDYTITNDDAFFYLTFTNVYKDLYLVNKTTNERYYPDANQDMSTIRIGPLNDGTAYEMVVYTNSYGSYYDCRNISLYSFYITTPTFNPYYQLDICKGYESYKLCNIWYNHGLTKEQFLTSMTNYIASLNKTDDNPSDEDKDQDNTVIKWYLSNYYYILPAIIIVGGYIIYADRKNNTFGF